MWVSAMRGLAGLDDPAIVSDPVAVALLPMRYRIALRAAERAPNVSRIALRTLALATRNLSRHLALRTRAIDDVIMREARAGSEQLVLLGAGFDARAWRLDGLANTTVFEVDHPDTQAHKRDSVRKRVVSAPTPPARNVVWASIDFQKQTVDEVLERAGHDATRPTTFVWEGVTMYLDANAIDATLAAVSRRAAPKSCLAMTYHDVSMGLELLALDVMVRVAGEPFRTRMKPDEVRTLLAKHALKVETDEGLSDWSETYLHERGYASGERLAVARRL